MAGKKHKSKLSTFSLKMFVNDMDEDFCLVEGDAKFELIENRFHLLQSEAPTKGRNSSKNCPTHSIVWLPIQMFYPLLSHTASTSSTPPFGGNLTARVWGFYEST